VCAYCIPKIAPATQHVGSGVPMLYGVLVDFRVVAGVLWSSDIFVDDDDVAVLQPCLTLRSIFVVLWSAPWADPTMMNATTFRWSLVALLAAGDVLAHARPRSGPQQELTGAPPCVHAGPSIRALYDLTGNTSRPPALRIGVANHLAASLIIPQARLLQHDPVAQARRHDTEHVGPASSSS